MHGGQCGIDIDTCAVSDNARRTSHNVLCKLKDRHCNIKCVGNEINRYPRFEKPLEKHERVNVVHIVLVGYHSDKLITKNVGDDKPRNRNNDVFR